MHIVYEWTLLFVVKNNANLLWTLGILQIPCQCLLKSVGTERIESRQDVWVMKYTQFAHDCFNKRVIFLQPNTTYLSINVLNTLSTLYYVKFDMITHL